MSAAEQVRKQIERFPEGKVFGYRDFSSVDFQTIALTLSRLTALGKITRLSKGKYYIPRQSRFGLIGPSDDLVVASIVNSTPGSYISGPSGFNQLGLSTQIPSEITIVSDKSSRRISIGKVQVQFKKGVLPESDKDLPLLQILNALQEIKKIQDSSISNSVSVLRSKIVALKPRDLSRLVELSFRYRPFTRALLGALLESENCAKKAQVKIRSSLNQLTQFVLPGLTESISNARAWGFR